MHEVIGLLELRRISWKRAYIMPLVLDFECPRWFKQHNIYFLYQPATASVFIMGAYVSVSRCPNGSTDICNSNFNISNGNLSVGRYLHGQVPANPDIADIGVSPYFLFDYLERH